MANAPWTARQRHQNNMSRSSLSLTGDEQNRRGNSKNPGATKKHQTDAKEPPARRCKSVVVDATGDTRFMPVGAVHKAYRGRRLGAVQAWDPSTAAAVRAVRAENLLRGHAADASYRSLSEYSVAAVGGGAWNGATPKEVTVVASKGGRRGRPSTAPIVRRQGLRGGGHGGNCEGRGRGGGDSDSDGRAYDTRCLRDGHRYEEVYVFVENFSKTCLPLSDEGVNRTVVPTRVYLNNK